KESSFRITSSSNGTDCMNLNEFCMDAFGTQTFSERNMKTGFSFMSGHAGPPLQVSPNIGDGHKTAPAPWVPRNQADANAPQRLATSLPSRGDLRCRT